MDLARDMQACLASSLNVSVSVKLLLTASSLTVSCSKVVALDIVPLAITFRADSLLATLEITLAQLGFRLGLGQLLLT
jgi:hypothetical protein